MYLSNPEQKTLLPEALEKVIIHSETTPVAVKGEKSNSGEEATLQKQHKK